MWTLITGAGSGIGRAVSLDLARRGHDLILAGRTASRLERVAEEIGAYVSPGRVFAIEADLADPEDCRGLARQVGDITDRLDSMVYCAGVGEPAPDLAHLDIEDFEAALAVNVTAPLVLTQSLIPVLVGRKPAARLVMLGAGMDRNAQPGTGSYGISKMALRRLVHQLSIEFDPAEGDPAICLFQPGLVDTPGIRSHLEKAEALRLPHARWLKDRLEKGGCLTAEEAASAIAHVLEEVSESDFHGEVFEGREVLDSLPSSAP